MQLGTVVHRRKRRPTVLLCCLLRAIGAGGLGLEQAQLLETPGEGPPGAPSPGPISSGIKNF